MGGCELIVGVNFKFEKEYWRGVVNVEECSDEPFNGSMVSQVLHAALLGVLGP